jgi:hypothetical protein
MNRGPGGTLKDEDNLIGDDEFEEEEIEEPDDFDPKKVEEKCKAIPQTGDRNKWKEARARCVCGEAEGADLSEDEMTSRCKQLRMTVFKVGAIPYSCKHATMVSGCKPFYPGRGLLPTPTAAPTAAPTTAPVVEERNQDDAPVNDNMDDELLDDELQEDPTEAPTSAPTSPPVDKDKEDANSNDKEEKENKVEMCKLCQMIAGNCDFFPPLGYDGDAEDKDMKPWCAKNCRKAGSSMDCESNDGPVVEEKQDDEDIAQKDEPDDIEDLDEDLDDSDEIKEEVKKEPTLTCAHLTKSATPGDKMATMAQLKKWCGGETCGSKLKMRTWAICGLADGRVMGPGYNGVVNNNGNGPYDCYINCKGEAEKISGMVEDCISSFGNWGRCSRNCGGGTHRRQLIIKKYPSAGGQRCPSPPSRRCHTHACPPPRECFPADASVETTTGLKLMSDLRVGDRVRAVDGAGKSIYDEIYFFGHAENSESNEYVNLKLSETGAAMQISHQHFLPTCPQHGEDCNWDEHIHAYAQEVQPGDYVWVATSDKSKSQKVLATSTVVKKGLYNPYTLSGKIVVDGVVASAHSNWVLDDWTPSAMSQYLPAVYQVLFLPGRLLYQFAGASAADFLDVNNPQLTGTHGYGPEFLGGCLLSCLAVIVMALRGAHSK